MATLKQPRYGALQRDPESQIPGIPDLSQTGGITGGPVGQVGDGGQTGQEGNPMRPIELNPGRTPRTPGNINTPPNPTAPQVIGGPVDKQAFLGGGSNTQSPPSVTQQQPFVSLSSPSPDSLVFPGGEGHGLFGSSGGQFGGGLGLAGGQQGQEDPSSLLLALLSMMGK